jgi:hypothetical protein
MGTNDKAPKRHWEATRKEHFFDLKFSHYIEIILTAALVGIAYFQYTVYTRQAGIMDTQTAILSRQTDISVASGRAFVNFEDFKVISIDTGPAGPGKVVGIFFNVVNSGNVPTQGFRSIVLCKQVLPTDATPEPFDFFKWDESKATSDVIGPKQKGGIGYCNVNSADIPEIQFGRTYMYLLAEVRYKDRIDPTPLHRTRSSQQFFVSHVAIDDNGLSHFYHSTDSSGRNNCADEDCPKD